MAFIPAAATVKVQFKYSALGQVLYNVLWFRDTADAVSIEGMEDLAFIMEERWVANMAPLTASDVALTEIIVTDWSGPTAPSVTRFVSEVGDLTAALLPLNCTFTTTFKTVQRGRSGRGRAYFVGLHEGQVTGNAVLSTPANAIVAAWEDLCANATTGSSEWEHVVVSFVTEGAPRTDAYVQPVTSYSYYDLSVDSQRRRLTGRGS